MRPLDGIRVLELARVLSGPHCGKFLCDLGADVIKVEPPEGDITRRAQPRVDGVAVYFSQQNCGKRCISVDLGTEAGRDIVAGLAARSDVVLENFRPGVLDRLGLGYDTISPRNPGVIYCSITGYGQTGSASRRRAYAPAMAAEVGYVEFAARKHRTSPVPEALSHPDMYAGLQATIAILSALYQREITRQGQHLDVSMAETMLAANEWTAVELAGGEGGRPTVFGGYNAPLLRLGDGTMAVVPGDPASTFAQWARTIGRPELIDDPRFIDHAARDANRAEMISEFQTWAETVPDFETFEAALAPEQLAAGQVRSVAEAAQQPWAEDRDAVKTVGNTALPFAPWRFSGAEAGVHGKPAYQGEHNAEVLGQLIGMDEAEVDALVEQGVLHVRPMKTS